MKRLFILLLLLILIKSLNAQWHQTSGPDCNFVYSIKSIDNYLFASSQNGVFRSSDGGDNWVPVNTGLTDTFIFSLEVSGNKLFAGTAKKGVFISSDYGNTWKEANNGLTTNRTILTLLAQNGNIYAGFNFGLVFTNDYGITWNSFGFPMIDVGSIIVKDSLIIAGSYTIYISDDNGITWNVKNKGLPDDGIADLGICDSILLVLTANWGLYKSYDYGENWEAVTSFKINTNNKIMVYDSLVFIGTSSSGIYFSSDYGNNWRDINDALGYQPVYSIAIKDDYLYAGTAFTGVWKRKLSEIVTGIENNTNAEKINVFPNPLTTTTTFTLPISPAQKAEFRLYNITGKLVKQEAFIGNSFQLKRGNLPTGMYLYHISAGEKVFTGKVLVE